MDATRQLRISARPLASHVLPRYMNAGGSTRTGSDRAVTAQIEQQASSVNADGSKEIKELEVEDYEKTMSTTVTQLTEATAPFYIFSA